MSKSKNSCSPNRRPFPVINKFPERDVQPLKPQFKPGNSKYSESVNFGRNTYLWNQPSYPDAAIIHAGWNDVRNRELSSEQIAWDI